MIIEKQLEKHRKLAGAIDVMCCCAIFIPLLCVTVWGVWDSLASGEGMGQALVWVSAVLLVGYPFVKFGGWLNRALEARFAPGFVIDDTTPGVVRLLGSVRIDGSDNAVERLLAVRPGYHLHRGDTFKEFGCTMVAVPATPEFIRAKAELNKLGIEIQ